MRTSESDPTSQKQTPMSTDDDSSPSSSSSSGPIILHQDTIELTNANAGDWTEVTIDYDNQSGRDVASADFGDGGDTSSGGGPETQAAGGSDPQADGGDPVEVISITSGTITLKSTANVGPSGLSVYRQIQWKDAQGQIIDSTGVTFDVKQTAKHALGASGYDFSQTFDETMSAIANNVNAQGFLSSSAGTNAQASATQALTGPSINASIKENLSGAIANITRPDDVSLSLGATATVTLDLLHTDFGTWSLTGSYQYTWSPTANNITTVGSLGVSLSSASGQSKTYEFNIGLTNSTIRSTVSGGQSSNSLTTTVKLRLRF